MILHLGFICRHSALSIAAWPVHIICENSPVLCRRRLVHYADDLRLRFHHGQNVIRADHYPKTNKKNLIIMASEIEREIQNDSLEF